jgi:enoyl-CoA hydratase/carnithine racemase
MTYEFIRFERDENIAIITLDRPKVMNAWHEAMRAEVLAALTVVAGDDGIQALLMTGAGERAFSAGQDINESKEFDEDRAELWIEEFRKLYSALRSLEKPVVAALNGVTAGSAFQFVLLGDVRIGHPDTSMGQPEINSGIASITGPWIMREILGLARAVEMTLTGRMCGAEECLRLGLLQEIVPREQLMARAIEVAKQLAAKPPIAMRLIKRRIWEVLEPGFQETFDAAIRYHRVSYGAGEPKQVGNEFLAVRAARRKARDGAT